VINNPLLSLLFDSFSVHFFPLCFFISKNDPHLPVTIYLSFALLTFLMSCSSSPSRSLSLLHLFPSLSPLFPLSYSNLLPPTSLHFPTGTFIIHLLPYLCISPLTALSFSLSLSPSLPLSPSLSLYLWISILLLKESRGAICRSPLIAAPIWFHSCNWREASPPPHIHTYTRTHKQTQTHTHTHTSGSHSMSGIQRGLLWKWLETCPEICKGSGSWDSSRRADGICHTHTHKKTQPKLQKSPFVWAPLISSNINGLWFFFLFHQLPPSTFFSFSPPRFSLIASAISPMVPHPADKPHFCQSILVSTAPPPVLLFKVIELQLMKVPGCRAVT